MTVLRKGVGLTSGRVFGGMVVTLMILVVVVCSSKDDFRIGVMRSRLRSAVRTVMMISWLGPLRCDT
jgi:hypothetical protein